MEPFTEDEKRVLLAEIIKNSQLDVKILGRFIKSNRIEPTWVEMRLPAGRSMAECMLVISGMDLKPRSNKRKVTYKEELDSQGSKEPPSSSSQELPPLPRPAAASRYIPIVPRPSSSGSHESPLSQPDAPLPKRKRGRPMYAGREVAGYQPVVPRAIAPKPHEGLYQEQPRRLQQANGPAHRAILPKATRDYPDQGAPPSSGQPPRAQPDFEPTRTSHYSPMSTPRPAVARRNARRQLLGMENGLQGPMRLPQPPTLQPRLLGAVARQSIEEVSPAFRLQSRGDDRTATGRTRRSRASSEKEIRGRHETVTNTH